MEKKILIIGVLCCVSVVAFGNEVDSLAFVELQGKVDSLTIQLNAFNGKVEPIINWWQNILWFFGIAIAALAIFGISIKWNFKKTVNELIEKHANQLIEEKFAKTLQAKPEVVSAFFSELQRKEDIKKTKRFLIVSKAEGKQVWLNNIFDTNGFDTKNFDYRSFAEAKKIDTNNFDFVLFNNSVQERKEQREEKTTAEVKAIFELMELFDGKLNKQFYLGEHIPNSYLGQCKKMGVSFTTMPAYLTDNILSNS